uniref:Zinc finger MYM-type containing 3 n=1 Tax=Monodelphis domestica TaxID=13616 RepID=A0A5F8H1S3_MONDO
MDPSDFSNPFDALAMPEKPLAGDLPVDMEFGEDLLGSQTAPNQGWTPPGPPPTTEALDLLDTPAGLEKDPSVLDGATDLLGLGGLLYKAPSPQEVEQGPEGSLGWATGDQPLESAPRGQAPEVATPDPGTGASPALTEGLLEPLAPDSLINLEEEAPSTTARRKGPPGQEDELLQGQPPSPNAPPSPSVGETKGDGFSGSKTQPSPPAHPSLPGRDSRILGEGMRWPRAIGSSLLLSTVPVSDEDSDAMVDDPNDEDFVPFRPRRSPRMSLRSNLAPRAARSTATKMTCAHCRTPLQKGQTAYQRKGLPQLFCSSTCLTTFSKKPLGKKTCTFCKKEIWNTKDSVVAQTGAGGSFHEFCTSVCLSLYEAQQRPVPPVVDASDATRCSICQKSGEVLHEVSNGSVVHRLCSDSCFTKFRANKGLKTNCCDQCGAYIYSKEGGWGQGEKNTRVYPCVWCKTLCKNFEMLSHVDRNGKTGLFCSLCCTTSHKVKQAGLAGPPRPCSFCRRSLSDPCYYNKTDRTVYQFCSPSCWTKFQRTNPEGGIHLSCHYCHSLFSGKPEILDWQNQVFQFCCRDCCEDFKRLRGVVSQCEHCRQEKLLHEKLRFSGVEKSFCSEGCVLLYKQDFTKKLGLCCITCTYCSQTCQRAVTEQLDGSTWDFCSEDCKSKYLLWYRKAARCHACKRQGKLLETIHWRGHIRHFCNQQCLLRFYSQQNQPNLDTQSGPESLLLQSPNPPQPPSPKSPAAAAAAVAAPVAHLFPKGTAKSRSVPTDPTPPPAPSMPRKNKAAMCKPLMQNRGVSCKVDMRSKGCQTEQDWKPQVIVLPVPVPIFVPVPMHLYSQKVPVPLSLPIPVPVPMFLPTTLESTDKIVETIEELKVKIPSNPLEADILAMAEMIAEAEELDKASSDLCDLVSNQSTEGLLEDCDLFGPARDDVLAMAVKMANVLDEPGQDLEADFPKNPLDINPSVDFLFDCGLVGPDDVSTDQDLPRAIRKGQKRLVLSESCSRDSMSSQPSCTALNYSYGVNAWKCWVQSKYAGGESSKTKPMRIKEDILACTAAELNYGLAQFVREITRPNGERYEPDSIYYLCLGIQQYLLENNRMVNIFTDLYYLTFVQELNKSLSSWQPTILPNNTSSGKRKREDELPVLEQRENRMNPLRCPVKFYEFYLSKCPESLRTRNDVFYLQPERSCIAESPLWYSVIPMDRGMLESMLNRILAVREIYEDPGRPGEEDLD